MKKKVCIKITNRCLYNCPYCCENCSSYGEMMDFNIFLKILKEISRYDVSIAITGGDIMLYSWKGKTIIDIVDAIEKIGITTTTMMIAGIKESDKVKKIKGMNFYFTVSPVNRDWYVRMKKTFINIEKFDYSLGGISFLIPLTWEEPRRRNYLEIVKNEVNRYLSSFSFGDVITEFIIPTGRGKDFLKVDGISDYTCGVYESSMKNAIFINEKGGILPCCSIIDSSEFFKMGWAEYNIDNLDEAFKKSVEFCKKCKFRN